VQCHTLPITSRCLVRSFYGSNVPYNCPTWSPSSERRSGVNAGHSWILATARLLSACPFTAWCATQFWWFSMSRLVATFPWLVYVGQSRSLVCELSFRTSHGQVHKSWECDHSDKVYIWEVCPRTSVCQTNQSWKEYDRHSLESVHGVQLLAHTSRRIVAGWWCSLLRHRFVFWRHDDVWGIRWDGLCCVLTTSEAFVGTDCAVFCVGDFPRIREVGVTWWRLLELLTAHCGNADGLYMHLNVIPSVTLTSRADQLSTGVLRKNIWPRSKVISVKCVLVKCLNTLKTKWTEPSVLQERSMSQNRELTLR